MKPLKAFLFPGQGAQALGMAVDLVEAYPAARAVFDAGREILDRDILAICREGPEAELNSTRTSQPAIFLHSMAVLEVLQNELGGEAFGFCRGAPAFAAAGLSLGEYSALVFAGSLEFEEAVKIVGLRGEYMQEACDQSKGAMASVIGLPAEKVEEVTRAAASGGLAIGVANYNSPDQTVISGEAQAVDETIKRLEAAGARRAIRLKVAGAYHSPLMAPATKKLEPHLRKAAVKKPRIPFYSNVTGARAETPDEIRTNLIRQIENPVRWEQIARGLIEAGMSSALEIGPGRVLQGLLRNIQRSLDVVSVGACESLAKFREAV